VWKEVKKLSNRGWVVGRIGAVVKQKVAKKVSSSARLDDKAFIVD
jgi:hypothetical protein